MVLNDEGRIIEQGKFKDLEGEVGRLGLKELPEEVFPEKADDEPLKKKDLLTKIASIKSQKKVSADVEGAQSRGRRNADALVSYLKSMGNTKLLAFCFLTVGSTGFRIAGRKLPPPPLTVRWCRLTITLKLFGSMFGHPQTKHREPIVLDITLGYMCSLAS